jgi:hypothetical protein
MCSEGLSKQGAEKHSLANVPAELRLCVYSMKISEWVICSLEVKLKKLSLGAER